MESTYLQVMPFMLLHRVKKPIMAPNSRKNARQDKSATHYSEDVDCENRMDSRFFRPDTERPFCTYWHHVFLQGYVSLIYTYTCIDGPYP